MLRSRLSLAFIAAVFVAPAVGPEAASAAWTWPVAGEVITPYRNGSDPYATGQHRGIDIGAPVGATVHAAAAGDVRFAGTAGSSGLTISIRTSDGYDTSYLHLSALDVRAGAYVSAGERIGAVGTTGTRSAASPHLHFGVRDAGTRHAYHDPLAFLPPAPPTSPTPEPPAPAPAPKPEPSQPPPSPIPEPALSPTPAPVPPATPRRSPITLPRQLPRGAPVPHAAPRAFQHRLPVPASSPRPMAGVRTSPHQGPSGSPRLNRSPSDAPQERARSDRLPRAILSDNALAGRARGRGAADQGGPDIGWALACAGLLLAAAVLGLTEDGRRPTTRARSKLLAALPALGRR